MHLYKFFSSTLVLIFLLFTRSNGQDTPWQNIGPFMGYINSMAIDQAHPDTLYAATPYGIYKSVDCAEHWKKSSLTDIEINAIVVSRLDSRLLIASSDSVIYKSEDCGETWNEIWKSKQTIGAIAFDPADVQGIWAGVNVTEYRVYTENLFHSTDGGTQWDSVPFQSDEELKLVQVLSIHFDLSNDSVMYVAGWGDTYHSDGGLFVSRDKGENWTNFKPGGCSSNKVISVTTTPVQYEPHAAYVLVDACDIDKQVFKSLDFGATWEEVWTPFDMLEGKAAGEIIRVDLLDPQWIMVSGRDVVNSASVNCYNGEDNKWYYWVGSPHGYPKVILFHPDGNFLGFEDNGVYQNPGGGLDWIQKNNGMADVEILDIMTYPDGPDNLMVATPGNLAKTDDGGNKWNITGGNYTRLAINDQDTSIIFAGKKFRNHTFMSSFYIYISQDGGTTWESKKIFSNTGLLDYYYTLWVGDILVNPDHPEKILIGVDGGGACGEGLYRTEDGGDTWNKEFSTGVSTLAMDPLDHDVVYLGTTALGYVFRSEDGGDSWTRISPGGDDSFVDYVRDLGVDNNHQVFAVTSAGLFRWDKGESWSLIAGLPAESTQTIIIDNQPSSSVAYVGTKTQGVFFSDDGGSSWKGINDGLKASNITLLRINEGYPRNLYAGTKDGGVWITELTADATFVSTSQGYEDTFKIFPNPNSGVFNIHSHGNSDLKGCLQIINLLGEVVYADDHFRVPSNSSHEITVDQISSGCYILIFKNNHQTITSKIMVEKR